MTLRVNLRPHRTLARHNLVARKLEFAVGRLAIVDRARAVTITLDDHTGDGVVRRFRSRPEGQSSRGFV
jgi:hypothetical protein